MITSTKLQPARPIEPAYAAPEETHRPRLRLDRNEGPCCDAELLTVLRELTAEDLRRYTTSASVEAALARSLDVDPRRVLIASGGDDAIDRCCRVMLREGLNAVIPAPTFEMIPRGVRRTGAQLIEVDWIDGAFPREEVMQTITSDTRLVSIISPNNPTGLTADAADIEAICSDAARALVLVDLAYAEFADSDLLPAVLAQPNAVAVRTFSKAYGLAGLRLGYAIGSDDVIAWLRSIGSPYACSSVSLALAGRAIERGLSPDSGYIAQVKRERAVLSKTLRDAGWRVWDSQANFVLASCIQAGRVGARLLGRGIAVRAFDEKKLGTCLRITCPGDAGCFDELQSAITDIMQENSETCNV